MVKSRNVELQFKMIKVLIHKHNKTHTYKQAIYL